jgi:hypothetical protein
MTGYPRITRPRRRKNAENRSGFSLVDPAGNWIRVMASQALSSEHRPQTDPLTRALDNAVVLADSHGDVAQARKILAGALARHQRDADPQVRAEAEAYLAELQDRLEPLSGQPGD